MRQIQNDSHQELCPFTASPSAWPTLLVSFALVLMLGCAGGDNLTPASYSPDEAAKQVMAEYDTNKDGYLDAKELERCPSLKNSMASIDQNGDHRLSAAEIAGRIQVYADSQVALKNVSCRLFLDGRPLQGATVTYVPEKFMGTSLKTASGVSNSGGGVELMAEGEKLPGVQPGFYRVQVSKKNASGQETIPARYNQATILGVEVSPRKNRKLGMLDEGNADFRLTSKSK